MIINMTEYFNAERCINRTLREAKTLLERDMWLASQGDKWAARKANMWGRLLSEIMDTEEILK